ncbi:MAG: hypothetical protein DRN95_02620, partial [Candidatus Hydrothermarchaeota archaeon]
MRRIIRGLLIYLILASGLTVVEEGEIKGERVEYSRYYRDRMGIFYREAEKYKEERKWEEVVNRGKEIVIAEWERRYWEELMRAGYGKEEIEGKVEEGKKRIREAIEKEAKEKEGEWKGRRRGKDIRERVAGGIAGDKEEVREWVKEAEGEAESVSNVEGGIEIWMEKVMARVKAKKEEKRGKVKEWIEDRVKEAKERGEVKSKEEGEGYRRALEDIGEEWLLKWEWELDSEWVRARNRWVMERSRDESLRAMYEAKRADVVVKEIIKEAEERADEAVEEVITKEVVGGEWEGEIGYKAYEEAISKGLEEWGKALEELYKEWSNWREEVKINLAEAQEEWEKGYKRIKEERAKWLERTKERIKEGRGEWAKKWEEIETERKRAEEELERYINIQKQAWEEHISGLKQIEEQGNEILRQAENNIKWLEQKIKEYEKEKEKEYEVYKEYLESEYKPIERKYEEYKEEYNRLKEIIEGGKWIYIFNGEWEREEIRTNVGERCEYVNGEKVLVRYTNYVTNKIRRKMEVGIMEGEGGEIVYTNLEIGGRKEYRGYMIEDIPDRFWWDKVIGKRIILKGEDNRYIVQEVMNKDIEGEYIIYKGERYNKEEIEGEYYGTMGRQGVKDLYERYSKKYNTTKKILEEKYNRYMIAKRNYEYYKSELTKWEEIKEEIEESLRGGEDTYHNEDIWGEIIGIFKDTRVDNKDDIYYMSEDEKAVEKLKAEEGYWGRRLEIAKAVKEYAEAEGGIKEKKEESERRLEESREEMELAVSNYKKKMEELRDIVRGRMAEISEEVGEAGKRLKEAREELEEKIREYEQARIVLLVMNNPEMLEQIKKDIEESYKRLEEIERAKEITLKEYKEAEANRKKKEEEKEYIGEIINQIKEYEDIKGRYKAIEEIIKGEGEITNIGRRFLDGAEEIWGESERGEKVKELEGLMRGAGDKEGREKLYSFLYKEIEEKRYRYEIEGLKYKVLIGEIRGEEVEGWIEGREKEIEELEVKINKEAARVIKEVIETNDIAGIESGEEYIERLEEAIEKEWLDEISFTEEGIERYLTGMVAKRKIEDMRSEIEQIFTDDSKKEERYERIKEGVDRGYKIAEKIEEIYREIEGEPDRRKDILYEIMREGGEINEEVAGYFEGTKELENKKYMEEIESIRGKIEEIKEGVREYIRDKEERYRERVDRLAGMYEEIMGYINMRGGEELRGKEAGEIVEKAEEIVEYIEGEGIKTAEIMNIKEKLEGLIKGYEEAEYIAENREKEAGEIEEEIEGLKEQIKEKEEKIGWLSEIYNKIYSKEEIEDINNIKEIIKEIERNRNYEEMGEGLKEKIEEIKGYIREAEADRVVRGYIEMEGYKGVEEYLGGEGIGGDEIEEIRERLKGWEIIKRYEEKREEIISSNWSIEEWVEGYGIGEVMEEAVKERIGYKEYERIKGDIENSIEIDLRGYGKEVRRYGIVRLFNKYIMEEGLDEEEAISRGITNFLNNRGDIGEGEREELKEILRESIEEVKPAIIYLPEEVREIIWKRRYKEYGEEKEEFIEDMEASGEESGIIKEVERWIEEVEALKLYRGWMGKEWYAKKSGLSEERIEKYEENEGIIEWWYNEALDDNINRKIGYKIKRGMYEAGEKIGEEIKEVEREKEGLERRKEKEEALKEYKEREGRGDNWRGYLGEVKGAKEPEINNMGEVIRSDKGIGEYDVGGGIEYNEARDRLEELRGGIIEVMEEIRGEGKRKEGIEEVKEKIGEYYTMEGGYNGTNRIEGYKDEVVGEYIKAVQEEANKANEYISLKDGVKTKREEIRRNGWILRETGKNIKEYED